MTTYQKTLIAYANGQKSMAFLAFKNDPTSNKELNFNQFCIAFDKLMIQHKGKRPFSGRKKAPYQTKTIAFRVRIEWVEEIKLMVKNKIKELSK